MQWQYTGNVTCISNGDKALNKNFYEFKKMQFAKNTGKIT